MDFNGVLGWTDIQILLILFVCAPSNNTKSYSLLSLLSHFWGFWSSSPLRYKWNSSSIKQQLLSFYHQSLSLLLPASSCSVKTGYWLLDKTESSHDLQQFDALKSEDVNELYDRLQHIKLPMVSTQHNLTLLALIQTLQSIQDQQRNWMCLVHNSYVLPICTNSSVQLLFLSVVSHGLFTHHHKTHCTIFAFPIFRISPMTHSNLSVSHFGFDRMKNWPNWLTNWRWAFIAKPRTQQNRRCGTYCWIKSVFWWVC